MRTLPDVRLQPSEPQEIERRLQGFVERYATDLQREDLGEPAQLKKFSTAMLLGECGDTRTPVNGHLFDIVDDAENTIVGYLWTSGNNFGFGTVLYLKEFHVDLPHRRKGYATAALAVLSRLAARNSDIVGVALAVMPSNHAAIDLYQKLGFRTFSHLSFKASTASWAA